VKLEGEYILDGDYYPAMLNLSAQSDALQQLSGNADFSKTALSFLFHMERVDSDKDFFLIKSCHLSGTSGENNLFRCGLSGTFSLRRSLCDLSLS